MSDRLTLALPVDVARQFDSTVTATQLDNDVFQGSADDVDLIASIIEDAEDEFRSLANVDMRLSRVGTSGDIETYEQVTYKVKGHQAFKRSFSRTGREYRPVEVEKNLANGRLLPFDSAQGDEAYIYRGTRQTSGNQWEDVTDDQGDTWDIINHAEGTVVFHPINLMRAMTTAGHGIGLAAGRLDEVRMAITYRHGALGGSRAFAGRTTLTSSLNSTDTPSALSVDDASRLPTGTGSGPIALLIDSEYILAEPDPSADTIDVKERGIRGTSGAAHSSGARVQYTPPSIRKAVAARSGMTLVQSGRYSAWLPDADDEVDKNDMLSIMKETWNRTVDAMS